MVKASRKPISTLITLQYVVIYMCCVLLKSTNLSPIDSKILKSPPVLGSILILTTT